MDHLILELEETFGPVIEDDGKVLKTHVLGARIVQADRQMLVQAMANLIQNAFVYGGHEITLIAEGNSIGVADNGLGFDPSHYDETIKPMVRLDAARGSDGSGLSLALVRAVAQLHGAKLTLSAQQDKARGLRVFLNFAGL